MPAAELLEIDGAWAAQLVREALARFYAVSGKKPSPVTSKRFNACIAQNFWFHGTNLPHSVPYYSAHASLAAASKTSSCQTRLTSLLRKMALISSGSHVSRHYSLSPTATTLLLHSTFQECDAGGCRQQKHLQARSLKR